jgi:hypothetical protein
MKLAQNNQMFNLSKLGVLFSISVRADFRISLGGPLSRPMR